jgi:predicted outer membrane repeat protein
LVVDFWGNNSADYGGAIYNQDSLLIFNRSSATFLNNTANRSGGAIVNLLSTASFVNSTLDFLHNTATGNGGAISNVHSSASFSNSTANFSGNSTKELGGAINNQDSLLVFNRSNATFSANSANGGGGAILNWDYSVVSFVNSTVDFLHNTATAETGGAIDNRDYSAVSFVKSRVNFLGNSSDFGGAILNYYSTASFVNSTVDFSNNSADRGGAIYNENSTVSFVNSIVSFTGNSAYVEEGRGGAIANSANSTIIFKGGSKVIFEDNLADGGADIYNNGIIEISERSEVILRSGIDGNPSAGGVINIKSGGVLTISADEIGIVTLNVSAGSKFSLVDRQAIFATVYTTKTAHIENLIVEGILEIGIDLSANDINDLILADSITFQKGSSLKIVPFNKWSSPKIYLIFEGDLRGFENLDYDHSRFVLRYDKKTKTLSLKVIKDPTL